LRRKQPVDKTKVTQFDSLLAAIRKEAKEYVKVEGELTPSQSELLGMQAQVWAKKIALFVEAPAPTT
jgi:hypothetical protein